MSNLPKVSGAEMVAALRRIGYEVARQEGSHVRMRHPTDPARRPTTVPMHKELKTGTLLAILRDANLTRDEFKGLLDA